jgi:hypothetical protein
MSIDSCVKDLQLIVNGEGLDPCSRTLDGMDDLVGLPSRIFPLLLGILAAVKNDSNCWQEMEIRSCGVKIQNAETRKLQSLAIS